MHALPRTHVYLDITISMGVLTCIVSSPKKKKLESKLSNSPWGHMKGPVIFNEYSEVRIKRENEVQKQ